MERGGGGEREVKRRSEGGRNRDGTRDMVDSGEVRPWWWGAGWKKGKR